MHHILVVVAALPACLPPVVVVAGLGIPQSPAERASQPASQADRSTNRKARQT
ncbi:hypothetical protein [Oryza sativa Japonica Group]|uniref:Uncharacterized protein n=1 Tax=Oryza sativa subsp. japonica TaxID=39947 RepID=Q5SN46_ORYSJ|nr:hypothetical protein [Oryza sativa Japonica Group]